MFNDDETEDIMLPEENPDVSAVREIYEWVESLAFASVVVVLIFTFIFRIVGVDGRSMYPTLHDADRVIISNLLYTPRQGDIIVTTQPHTPGENSVKPLIKRIIAVGGQTINIDYNEQKVYIDGEVFDERYINFEEGNPLLPPQYVEKYEYPYTVPEGFVFVMGDNRNHSSDSRYTEIGVIDNRYILGKLIYRLLPLNRFGKVN